MWGGYRHPRPKPVDIRTTIFKEAGSITPRIFDSPYDRNMNLGTLIFFRELGDWYPCRISWTKTRKPFFITKSRRRLYDYTIQSSNIYCLRSGNTLPSVDLRRAGKKWMIPPSLQSTNVRWCKKWDFVMVMKSGNSVFLPRMMTYHKKTNLDLTEWFFSLRWVNHPTTLWRCATHDSVSLISTSAPQYTVGYTHFL